MAKVPLAFDRLCKLYKTLPNLVRRKKIDRYKLFFDNSLMKYITTTQFEIRGPGGSMS